jgi:LL-diaminopimelate aminotransferase
VLIAGLHDLGFDIPAPKATFYVWVPVPDCMAFCAKLLNEAGIVATPGVGFGSSGEGYVRFAITRPVARIREAIERMRGLSL